MNAGLASKRRIVLVLGFLTGIAAVTIDVSLPAFPDMVRDLATSMSSGQKVVGFFLAGIALGQLPAGLMAGPLVERRPPPVRLRYSVTKASTSRRSAGEMQSPC